MATKTAYVGTLFDNSASNPSKITLAFTMAEIIIKLEFSSISGALGAPYSSELLVWKSR